MIRRFISLLRKSKYCLNPKIKIGKNVYIGSGVKIHTNLGGSVTIGNNCEIHDYTQMLTYGGNITIGNNCSLNQFCMVYGDGGVHMGDNVRIATQTVIVSANHIFEDKNKPIFLQGESKKGINIESDVWLGAGCKILDGVRIEKGVVVGAGAVVTKNLEAFGVYGGVPAKLIKKR